MSGDLEREIVRALARSPLALRIEQLLYPLAMAMDAPRDRLRRDVGAVLADLVRRGSVNVRGAGERWYWLSEAGRERYAHALGEQRDEGPRPTADVCVESDLDTALAQWAEDVPHVLAAVREDLAGGNGPRALSRMAELRIDLAQLSARLDIEAVLGPHAWLWRPSALRAVGNSGE